jgi:hypothetical protein
VRKDGDPGLLDGQVYWMPFRICNYGAFDAMVEEWCCGHDVCLEDLLNDEDAHLWNGEGRQEAQA